MIYHTKWRIFDKRKKTTISAHCRSEFSECPVNDVIQSKKNFKNILFSVCTHIYIMV